MTTRRRFLSAAVPGLMFGIAPAARALSRDAAFVPDAQADDAAVFAAAREHFLIPAGVAYCNTGTLGASPREVVDALTEGIRRLETDLAAWPYEQPDGEPLTGYQQLLEVRGAVGRFVNAPAAEIALTQNATMGMNFLANGLDLAAGRRGRQHRPGARRRHLALAPAREAPRHRRQGTAARAGARRRAGRDRAACSRPR